MSFEDIANRRFKEHGYTPRAVRERRARAAESEKKVSDFSANKNADESLRDMIGIEAVAMAQREMLEKARSRNGAQTRNAVTERYGIDPDSFTTDDLIKWGAEHNQEPKMNSSTMEMYLTPKYSGGFLGIGAKKLSTAQEDEDREVLTALAKNNDRKKLAQKDNGAAMSAVEGFGDGLSFGAIKPLFDEKTKKEYKKAGLDPDKYVSASDVFEKSVKEHPVANTAGNIGGSTASLLALGKLVGAAAGGVKWIAGAPEWVQGIINNTITFAADKGARAATGGKSAKEVARSTGIGAIGGAAGSVVGNLTGTIANKLLSNPKIRHRIITAMAQAGAEGAGFSAGETASTYFLYPEGHRPSAKEMVRDIGAGFAFAAISKGISGTIESRKNKEVLDELLNLSARDYENMVKLHTTVGENTATVDVERLANNVLRYSEAMENYLKGRGFEIEVVDYSKGTPVAKTIRQGADAHIYGQQKRINTVIEELGTIKAAAKSILQTSTEATANTGKKSQNTASTIDAANTTNTPAAVPVSDNAADLRNTPVIPVSDTITAAAETAAPQSTAAVNASTFDTNANSNTGGELGEIMDSEPIVTFTPKTASGEVKRLENILIAKGADDTSRKEIVDTAVEIEKTLDSSDKNIRSVFDNVSKITSTAIREIQSGAGLSNAYWKLFGENFKSVSTGNAKENAKLVTEYSNAYAQALKNNNPEKYNSVMLSSDGQDLSAELPKTVMRKVIPNNVQNAGQYRLIATQIKNIINAADIQLESERKEIYGDNANVSAESNTKPTETQTVTEPKNITLTRMGDFYEAFGNEALELAEKLNLTPAYKTVNGVKTAMVGFPVHTLEKYQSVLGNNYNLILSDNTVTDPVNNMSDTNQNDADIKNAQKYNILVSNLKNKAAELGLLDNNFYTNLQNINMFNPSGADKSLISKEFHRIFANNTDPLVSGWLDGIGAETVQNSDTVTTDNKAENVINHAREVKGMTLVSTQESTLVNGQTLLTGVYELNSDKDFNRKSYKKEEFSIFDKAEPWTKTVSGVTYGHYGFIKSGTSEYTIAYLPAGIAVTKAATEKNAKSLLKALDEKYPKLPLEIKAYGDGYRCSDVGDELKTDIKNFIESAIESTSEINLPLKNKKELISYLKNHKGNKIGVSYNRGAEEIRTIVSASGSVITTEREDGQGYDLRAKANELSYTEDGFVYTGSNGVTVSYRFIDEDISSGGTSGKVSETRYPHLYDEKKVSKEYINSVDNELLHFVNEAKKNVSDNKSVYIIGKSTNRLNKNIMELTGIDTVLFNHYIKSNSIRHIIKDHGINGLTDNSMSDSKDIARMGYVIQKFDDMDLLDTTSKEYRDKNQQPAKMVKLSKRIDGTYYVVEAVPDTKAKSLAVVSAYIKKAPAQQTENVQALSSNVRNGSVDTGVSDNSISQENKIVNSTENNKVENATDLTDKCELIATTHTATGSDIWVVTLKDRLSSEEYKDLSGKVKAVGGYYSRFAKTPEGKAIPGFIFKSEPAEKELSVFNNFFGYSDNGLKKEPESDIIKKNPTTQIAEYVTDKLANGEKITALELSKISSEAFGGTMADNAYNIKDAYDAMELGVNKYILSMKDVSAEKMLELLELLPTQTKRTEEMVKYQQFSTPPSIAYLANYAANVSSKDTMLEPSAGIGGIAVFAKRAGATVYVNELDNRRLEILKNMPFDKFFNENAEQLDNILGGEIEPSVIVMNPPFSSSSERNIQNTKIGAKHIEQALKILAPNGRLVAIVGHGMGDGAPAFRNWWKDIKSQYNVKANIRINGKNYNKYGTNFDIQMLVIDKNGATTRTETGYVDTLQELQEKLEVIRDERPVFDYSGNEQRTPAATRSETVKTGKSGLSGNRTVSDNNGIENNRSNTGNVGNAQRNGKKPKLHNVRKADEPVGSSADEVPTKSDVMADEQGDNGSRQGNGLSLGGGNGLQNTGRTDRNTDLERSEQSKINGDNGNTRTGQNNVGRQRLKKKELTDSIFERYQTQPLKLKNTKPHPARVSESAAMSAIEPPVITYKPNIPQNVVENGILSDVQLEAISYAGQSHSQTLPDGTTRGFFLGDGTGIGKGRTIAGMILDNYNQGRKKALWVTLNASLVNDAKRDVKSVFGNSDLVTQFVGGKKADSVLNKDEAVMVISYTALSTGYDNVGSNFEKIIDWLGKDFDGLIVFDESHKMGNASPTKGIRGVKKASKTGLAGIALQEALPKAKIVYSSATGATEVENLRYAERLGLWGEGTAFATGDDFISKIKAGGLAAMELIARDMKAIGVYLSRNISYEDVRYDKITHKLSREQRKIYDELARSWQIVLNDINKALNTTNQSKDGTARGRALGAFWSSQQRFFNQILTSMQVPSVISDIEKQLADGKSCVIQLVSTNESAQNDEFVRLKENDLELDEFDLTPKQMLMSYIENSFPVQQYEEYRDDEGNIKSKAVFDSKGNPVLNRDAVRQREELLSKLGSIKVPSSPIDMIINHFGTDMVAENTGRARRVVQKDGKLVEEKIGSKKDADVDAFQNGKKRIIIFSKAGGTGKSYHADRAAKNQQQRVHYLLEAGWQADNAVQGFGRSHRSNQAVAPIFKLVTTDLKGQMRFISTIAKRLDQLGAMTKGQRQAGGQGMFSASDNLENSLAQDVLAVFYKDLILNRVEGINNGLEIISKLGLKDKILNEYNQVIPTASELREVNKFLNRILSLESSEQNTVFEGYQQRLQDATEKAILAGTLDKGLENYKADKITLNEVQDIREDERSGAKTKYYNLTAEHKIKPVNFEDIPKSNKFVGYYQNKTTGNIRAVVKTSSTTDQYGNVTDNFKLIGQVKNGYIAQNRFYGNWNKLSPGEAEKLWNEEIAKLPEYRKESLHLISGVVLPVWDKLPTESVRIYRVLTSDGEMLIGRVIPEDRIDEVLRRLGSSRKKEKIATKDLIGGIKNGDTVYLENDWKIVQRKVSGENRIEIVGPSYEHYDLLTKKGVFTERISYNTRYFIPADTNTEKIVDEILKISPVMRVENAKYSIAESEDLTNDQTGSSILSGNSGRKFDASTRKQAKRVSSYRQKLEGKTAPERKSTAKELSVKGYTEEVISGNHKYTLIKEDG